MHREDIQSKVTEIIRKSSESSARKISDVLSKSDNPIELDSLSALKLIVELENEFNIEFDDEDFNADVLRSVSSISDYVSRKIRG